MARKSMDQKAQQVQLIIFPPMYFELIIAYRKWE